MTHFSLGVATAIGALFLIVIVIYLRKKRIAGDGSHVSYLHKGDPQAQKTYDSTKHPAELSFKDLVEASWQFLYDITDIVTTKFSSEDREATLSHGKVLLSSGGNYEHVVEYGIRHNLGRANAQSDQEKGV
jgi:hypothetical protein